MPKKLFQMHRISNKTDIQDGGQSDRLLCTLYGVTDILCNGFLAKRNAMHFALCYRKVCVCVCLCVCVCVCVLIKRCGAL